MRIDVRDTELERVAAVWADPDVWAPASGRRLRLHSFCCVFRVLLWVSESFCSAARA